MNYKLSAAELESQIPHLSEKKITELTICDEALSKNKKKVIFIMNKLAQFAPEVFVSFLVDASVIDKELVAAASQVFVALEIPLECKEKGGKLLFDKKYYAGKARLLNDYGLVFGFSLTYGLVAGDSQKAFMERLDFVVQQYPNHIDFPQTENDENEPKVTGIFSAKDIRYCRDVAFACRTFYSAGRAVPWFLSVLKPLRIYPSRLFADFSEWQRVNNCDYKSGFVPESEKHIALEKMQLLFLEQKYEEKNQRQYIGLVNNIIRINGAMSRLAGEGEESVLEIQYHPDDLFGPESMSLEDFIEDVCMEQCKVKIFAGEDGPDYEVL